MAEALDFQSLIMVLEKFWADNGCLIWQPYHTEVGAGTMNPATSLRVLGPEPWNVGYVEPSIRPDDGRYGENPNRFYQHTQYQVILKPDPGNPQGLYLKSLEAMGIDPGVHDIRFVEDNWKSPALGAWGLGWEVWLNGLEITQFTYFQQSGGQALNPVSVELTYGLERIAMALQDARDFKDIRWNEHHTYGDVQLQSEQQYSKYAFELADVDNMRELYRIYEEEAKRCLEAKQVLPAHDYVLKCSHTFNLLDTRGAVGVTERQGFFHRMRDLSRQVADAYLEERQTLEFPWLDEGERQAAEDTIISAPAYPKKPAPFLLEIGTEELPSGDVVDAVSQLEKAFPMISGWIIRGFGFWQHRADWWSPSLNWRTARVIWNSWSRDLPGNGLTIRTGFPPRQLKDLQLLKASALMNSKSGKWMAGNMWWRLSVKPVYQLTRYFPAHCLI
jgi:glycyl-tRNA synthetase